MRFERVSQIAFAATMIAIGIASLLKHDFGPIWQPSPKNIPARDVLVYLCGSITLLAGIGLLWRPAAAVASRVLLVYLMIWLLLFRVPKIFVAPTSQDTWSGCAETASIVAGAWVLYVWCARGKGLRIATTLYGLALIPFGLAHFRYLKETAGLVPGWLPWHTAWAFFTGCTFLVAGIAVLIGVYARQAAMLSALQLGLFTLLVWVPMMASRPNAFQWSEFVISVAVTAGAWVVADSYRALEPARIAVSQEMLP